MPAAYHFKAVAGDGKIRTGILHSDNERAVARELRAQGLAPVYIGLEQIITDDNLGHEYKFTIKDTGRLRKLLLPFLP